MPGRYAVWSPEIEPVGKTGTDLIVFPDSEQMLVSILIGKHNVMGVPEKLQPDIRAGAFQYSIGLSSDLESKQYGFCGGAGGQQDTEDEKGNILLMEEEDEAGKETADPDKEGQDQPL